MPMTLGTLTLTQCRNCKTPCPPSICRLSLGGAPSKVAKLATAVLARSGFEVTHRLSLSRLAEERLGVKADDVEVLYLKHSLLLLQYFVSGGDSALLFPFVAILRAQGPSTHLCFCSPWSTEGLASRGLSPYLAKQMEERLIRAASGLEDSTPRRAVDDLRSDDRIFRRSHDD